MVKLSSGVFVIKVESARLVYKKEVKVVLTGPDPVIVEL